MENNEMKFKQNLEKQTLFLAKSLLFTLLNQVK